MTGTLSVYGTLMPTQVYKFAFATAALASAALLSPYNLQGQELPNLPALAPEDLATKDNPKGEGVPAEILYEAIETDNRNSTEVHSVRIKIFREEGRKHANIEIPYGGKEVQVDSIRARSIDSAGHVSEFTDTIYDREIVKAKKFRVQAKVFAFPNVQPGTILEYSYRLQFKTKIPDAFRHPEQYLISDSAYTFPAALWVVQHDLYLRHGHYTLHAAGPYVFTHTIGLPKLELIRKEQDRTRYDLDLEFVPPFEEEEYAPPEDILRAKVDVFYGFGYIGPSGYWTDFMRRRSKEYEGFLKKSKAVEREAARLVSATDSDEQKLRKLYERAQQIRAVSFETEKTEKERKREKLSENKNAEDVLTHGYAFANEINLLFVGLARAAGFKAYPFLVTSRRSSIFLEDWPFDFQLNAMVVQVEAGSHFVYLDPATRYCPYGLLPWDESDAQGMRIDIWIPWRGPTPLFKSTDAQRKKTAKLKLAEDGTLRGSVQLEFSGQEALSKRLEAIGEDDAERRKTMEDDVKEDLPQSATVNLTSMEGWEKEVGPLRASFEIEIPNYASQAGRRTVVPVGVFHTRASNPFPSPRRVYPIYFAYPRESVEELTIEIPEGSKVEASLAPSKSDQHAAYYELRVEAKDRSVEIVRTLRFSAYLFDRGQYPGIRAFYDGVFAADAQQLTLVPRAEKQ